MFSLFTPKVPTITVKELKSLRDAKKPHFLLDVREQREWDAAKIEGAKLIPMGEVAKRFADIPKDVPVIVHCHKGGRSAKITKFLLDNGYSDVKNLGGGIEAWSEEIDPAVPLY